MIRREKARLLCDPPTGNRDLLPDQLRSAVVVVEEEEEATGTARQGGPMRSYGALAHGFGISPVRRAKCDGGVCFPYFAPSAESV